MDINNTAIEDTNQGVKNLSNRFGQFKSVTDKVEANIREQLDIIQSLNGKINSTNDEQNKFKKDIFERFVGLSEELISKQGKEELNRTKKVIELTEKFEHSMQESVDEIMVFRKEFYSYKETKESEIADLDERYGKLTTETLERVNKFEETITLNVGGMLKDLNDIKL